MSGRDAGDQPDCFLAVGRLSGHLEALSLQQCFQTLADKRVIISLVLLESAFSLLHWKS